MPLLCESKSTPLPVNAGEVLLQELQLSAELNPSLVDPCQIPFLQREYLFHT